ncbi:MAG: hypothetical protein WDA20_08930 [Desulfuromonadales bacterium]
MPYKDFLAGLFLCLTAGLVGCAAPAGGKGGEDRYYLNANLGLAIEYPANWIRVRDVADPTEVKWSAPPDKKRHQPPALLLSAIPLVPDGGTEFLEENFFAAHPGFVVADRQEIALPASPGRRLLGHLPQRKFLVYLLPAMGRTYILEFSAHPEDFEASRSLFESMAKSFRILQPRRTPAQNASER